MDNKETYIEVLIYSLQTKMKVLDDIIKLTDEQELLLTQGSSMDIDEFNRATEDKGILIDKVNELNDGFQNLYDKVKEELHNKKYMYENEIIQLQDLIKIVTEKSVEIQVKEKRNSTKFQRFLNDKAIEIKEFKKNSNTVANYYKSMSNQHQGQSYFIDKKK